MTHNLEGFFYCLKTKLFKGLHIKKDLQIKKRKCLFSSQMDTNAPKTAHKIRGYLSLRPRPISPTNVL